jgi:hypothetical protein
MALPDPPITESVAYIVGAVMLGTASTVIFLMREFSKSRHLFYRVISLHNKEDDDRFAALSDEIWKIHLRNARRDGDAPPARHTFPRRRYLAETTEDGDELQFDGGARTG